MMQVWERPDSASGEESDDEEENENHGGQFSVELPTRMFADARADGFDVVGTTDENGVKYIALCGSVTQFAADKRTLAAIEETLVRETQVLTQIDLPVENGEGFEVITINNGRKSAMRAVQSQGYRCVLLVEPTRSMAYTDVAARHFLDSLKAIGMPDMARNLRKP